MVRGEGGGGGGRGLLWCQSSVGRLTDNMILQDRAATNISLPAEDHQVLMEKINFLILLMSVIFALLCIILSVCFML